MARPQADAKLGFFPLPPAAIPALLRHIAPPLNPGTITVFDPCAGKGDAVAAVADGLGLPPGNVHVVELSESRTLDLAKKYEKFVILGPASFMGTQISYNTFSLVYVNPPYSSEIGGGRREELTFLLRSINHATPEGLLVLVVPEDTVFDWGPQSAAMRRTIACRLADAEAYRLPEAIRGYHEIVIFGRKRREPVAEPTGPFAKSQWYEARDAMGVLGEPKAVHRLPAGSLPKRWRKIDFTPQELRSRIAASRLNRLLGPRDDSARPSPPLPPGRGHVALILASGELDGLICPPCEPPHVVRGTARKVRYRDEAKCESRVNDDGSESDKEVFSERIELIVRAVDPSGKILTFTDQPPEPGRSP